ncbi:MULTISPECIES: PTS fructose transporter subunit IIABC [Corynebacterium]|uniref:PTS lactose transporter subunit IIC n=1 Tax=Corynebacterium hadale TaxID=2026255 RepID=A0A269PCI6_9CORY|nr:fructose-specific PTS transporter subunit EIIC [Corynebacterium hadale]PAJ69599.1 PTS lactose transporter subunit IIC [Corynebacterium hadale]WKC60304.1 PTS system fructose-specific EIIABC component [Corynebacterium hadale]
MNSPLITPDLVRLDVDFGSSPADVIQHLAGLIEATGRATDAGPIAEAATAREAKAGTGVNGRVAIPHCRVATVNEPTLAFARLSNPVDFSGPDGDAELVFLIGAPEGGGKEHLKILSKLARALVRGDFVEKLRNASTEQELVDAVLEVVNAEPKKKKPKPATTDGAAAAGSTAVTAGAAGTAGTSGAKQDVIRIAAVTSCATGIAHTYMAAEALTQAAEKRDNVELIVEPQGSSGGDPLEQSFIDSADAVIFAHDVAVRNKGRFAGKPVVDSPVKRGVNEPDAMIDEAIAAAKDPKAPRVAAASESAGEDSATGSSGESWPKRLQQAIMTGVSYMVPFVAAGGLLLALGFLLGGYDMANGWQALVTQFTPWDLPGHEVTVDGVTATFERSGWALYLGAVLFATGQMGMQFVVPALSGYIGYGLAGRPGIAPGFIGGAISVMVGAGFIGGLVTGLLAGVIAYWIQTWKVPRWLGSLMPVVIIPLLTSLIVGLLMFLLLGRPLEALMLGLTDWLSSMTGSSAILLGIIIGLMMCFDLGGPVNKAAYLFGTAGLSAGTDASFEIMATVMIAGMVPPIALSIATFLRKELFTPAEQENGKSAWLLGLSFVSEGAIPFAAADPFRVIPAMMLGGATAGAVSMGLGVGCQAPHGGVFVIFAYDPWWGMVTALAAGVLVAALAVIAIKRFWPNKEIQKAAADKATQENTASAGVQQVAA